MANKQLCRYAFTLHGDDVKERIDTIKETLKTLCNRWVFQMEVGTESGKRHLQGRLSFKQAKRIAECQKVIKGAHFSPEHDTAAGEFYCMKEETREEGPWSDQEEKRPTPWDLERITEWHPWQNSIYESLKERDDRVVNVLYDEEGNIGKSKVLKYALWKKMAGVIPVIGDAKDIIQSVCSMGARPAYILDMPRSGEGTAHMMSLFKAVEQIKNGVVMDFRYSYKELVFGSPVVWIFTNTMHDRTLLSGDRWRFWRVRDMELKVFRRCTVVLEKQ